MGSGAVIAAVAPRKGVGSDVYKPLIDIWQKLKEDPKGLVNWYAESRNRLRRFQMEGQTLEEELVSGRLLLTYPAG